MKRENSWIFTKDEVDNSPSTQTMSVNKEREMRKVACKFVQNVARSPRINLSRSTIMTAQMLLQRYFMRRTFQDNPWDVSIGAIFLASKIVSEYSSRISRYLIHECARIAKKIHDPRYELNPNEKEYGYWKNNMFYYEMEILRVLCFDVTFEDPFSYCSTMCKNLKIESKEVKAVTCYLLDESFVRTTLCLQYKAKEIAAGALFLSILQNDQTEAQQIISLFKENDIPIKSIKAVANELQSMVLKMDESLSPVHSQNETKQNTHISSGNGYSKIYSPQARIYIKSPLSQDALENSKQQQKNSYHSSVVKTSSNNVYSSPMASPVSLTELSVVDHTNSNEKPSYVNLSTNEFVQNNFNNKNKNSKTFISYNNNLKQQQQQQIPQIQLQGRNNNNNNNKLDKLYRQKKQDKLRQKNNYYNNNNRITKYHISHYTKISTTSKVYL